MNTNTELTTLVSLTDRELVHIRSTLKEERERRGTMPPSFDGMEAALIEKLENTASAFYSTHAPSAAPPRRDWKQTALLASLNAVAIAAYGYKILT